MAEAWFHHQNRGQQQQTSQTPPNTPNEVLTQGSQAFEILIEPLESEHLQPQTFTINPSMPMTQVVNETQFQFPPSRLQIERQQIQQNPRIERQQIQQNLRIERQQIQQNPSNRSRPRPTFVRTRTRNSLEHQPYDPIRGPAPPPTPRVPTMMDSYEIQLRVSGCQESCFQEKVKMEKSNQDLKRELRELKDERLCKVCLDGQVSHVFVPCGHAVCCGTCVGNIKECPLCRSRLQGSIIIYFT